MELERGREEGEAGVDEVDEGADGRRADVGSDPFAQERGDEMEMVGVDEIDGYGDGGGGGIGHRHENGHEHGHGLRYARTQGKSTGRKEHAVGVGEFMEKKSGSVQLNGRKAATTAVLTIELADMVRFSSSLNRHP
jgi:hypothetical protein